jgi:hypothetical protein
MLDNKLIEFGKTNEKPMVKSLNILKESILIEEFFSEKKSDTLALDMLIRSFYFYKKKFYFENRELDSLKVFVEYQLKDSFDFSISKIFTSHLNKIKFGRYINGQKELFNLTKNIIDRMPKNDWLSFDNIAKYSYYRKLYFSFEGNYKTNYYEFKGENDEIFYVKDYYNHLFHEPVLKAMFFYLGVLGLVELKYNTPITNHVDIRAKGERYISVWDGLKYIRFTELGKYIFKRSNSYTPKEPTVRNEIQLKFDEFKPIITVEKSSSITMIRLESFVEKLDGDRYILSHNKLFKDCFNLKSLKIKIDSFYKKIEKNPPSVFVDFFDEAIDNSNLMRINQKQIVIELKNNKRLLNLFMNNRKLKELFIKAEGYRIIVSEEDIPKIRNIVKDNGFFIEF